MARVDGDGSAALPGASRLAAAVTDARRPRRRPPRAPRTLPLCGADPRLRSVHHFFLLGAGDGTSSPTRLWTVSCARALEDGALRGRKTNRRCALSMRDAKSWPACASASAADPSTRFLGCRLARTALSAHAATAVSRRRASKTKPSTALDERDRVAATPIRGTRAGKPAETRGAVQVTDGASAASGAGHPGARMGAPAGCSRARAMRAACIARDGDGIGGDDRGGRPPCGGGRRSSVMRQGRSGRSRLRSRVALLNAIFWAVGQRLRRRPPRVIGASRDTCTRTVRDRWPGPSQSSPAGARPPLVVDGDTGVPRRDWVMPTTSASRVSPQSPPSPGDPAIPGASRRSASRPYRAPSRSSCGVGDIAHSCVGECARGAFRPGTPTRPTAAAARAGDRFGGLSPGRTCCGDGDRTWAKFFEGVGRSSPRLSTASRREDPRGAERRGRAGDRNNRRNNRREQSTTTRRDAHVAPRGAKRARTATVGTSEGS